MGFENLIESVITSFIDNKEQSSLFLSLPESHMCKLKGIIPGGCTVIDLEKDLSPLKPFLNIVSHEKISDSSIAKYAYPLHQNLYRQFFEKGYVDERKDKLILEEIYYEKVQFSEAIKDFFTDVVSGTYVILNAQEMCYESLEILKKIQNSVTKAKIVFCFNSLKIDTASEGFLDFYHQLDDSDNDNFYDISDLVTTDSEVLFSKEKFVPSYEQVLNALRNCKEFLALEQGYRLSKWVTSNYDKLKFNYEQKRELNLEMGLITFFAGYADEATIFINNILEKQIGDDIEIKATYYLSCILFERSARNTALKYNHILQQKLVNSQNNTYYALSVMQDYYITEHISLEKYSAQQLVDRYQKTISILKKHQMFNNASKVSMVIPLELVENKETIDFVEDCIDEALFETEKLHNDFGHSTACHWKGIVLSHKGESDEALNWYYKCSELRAKVGEVTSLMKIRNGISYEMLIRSNFKEAYNLINSFVDQLIEIEDYAEIIITLNNQARAIFYARQYDEANLLIQKIIHLLFLLEIKESNINSFIPEYNNILLYKTIIDYSNGDYIRAKINLHNILNNGKAIADFDICFLHLNQALIELHDKKLEEAKKAMKLVDKDFETVLAGQEYRKVFVYYEFANALDREGYPELSKEYFNIGFELAKQKNYLYFTRGKDKLTIQEYLADLVPFSPVNVDLEKLEERAENRKLINQLDQRVRDSQFLNKVVSYNTDNANRVTYVKNVIEAVFDYTGAEAVFIAEKTELCWNVLAQLCRSETPVPSDKVWEEMTELSFKDPSKRILLNQKQGFMFCNLSKFEFEGAIIIIPGHKIEAIDDDNNILSIALMNIQAQLVMIKQNEHLLYISSTDQLSMLKNRRALQEHLALESEMIRRYEKKRKFYMHEAISFIDLDNFKYYNDTFGHEAGDLLIASFSRLMKGVYRKVDFVSRFGGDEFVVVLPNTSCPEAKRAGERLHEALEKAEYFIPDLEKLVGKKIEIPEKYRLGFSMGICSNEDSDDMSDMETTMINADHALYYSKQHEKGSITIWHDIKDSIAKDDKISLDLDSKNG